MTGCGDRSPESVDAYLEDASEFARPLAARLRDLIRTTAPDLEESIRWNSPSYKGRSLICGIMGFQKHVSLVFFRGAELPDPRGLLTHGQGKSAMRAAKFTTLKEIDPKMIRAWVLAALALDEAGPPPQPKREKKPKPVVPPELAAALDGDPALKARFARIRPSCRREYCEHVAEAKKSDTRERRVAQVLRRLRGA